MENKKDNQERNAIVNIVGPNYQLGKRVAISEERVTPYTNPRQRVHLLVSNNGTVYRPLDFVNGVYIAQEIICSKDKGESLLDFLKSPTLTLSGSRPAVSESEVARTRSLNSEEYHARFVIPKCHLERHRSKLGLDGSRGEE